MQRLLSILVVLLLAGCATPGAEQSPPVPSLSAVRENPSAYLGRAVRWGGTIAAVENRSAETCLELVARPLGSNGRPRAEDISSGRFIACVDGFLDPAIYSQGREVTVEGMLTGTREGQVGDYGYVYPVVTVEQQRLWQPRPERPRYYAPDPFWYGPWPAFGPWRYQPHPYYYRW